MSAARALGFIYLVMASVFGVAIALHQHPDWQRSANAAGNGVARFADAHMVRPATAAAMHQLVALFDAIDPPVQVARAKRLFVAHAAAPRRHAPIVRVAVAKPAPVIVAPPATAPVPSEPPLVAPRPVIAAPPTLRPLIDEDNVAKNDAPAPSLAPPATASAPALSRPQLADAAPAVPQANSAPLAPAELTRVVARMKQNLTPEMLANFELFLYVSKATQGPWAQHMYVFAKSDAGDLDLKYNWLVSTGRERVEFNDAGVRLPSFTPQGYYQLDPDRIYKRYTSSQWHQKMPFSMFFNYIKEGEKTGLAIHAATGDDIAQLGKRASAGCIRLSPANAATLFGLIKANYRGLAPRFAIDRRTGTMSNDGILVHDAQGHVQLAQGYKVLVFIENYGGNENVVAALF